MKTPHCFLPAPPPLPQDPRIPFLLWPFFPRGQHHSRGVTNEAHDLFPCQAPVPGSAPPCWWRRLVGLRDQPLKQRPAHLGSWRGSRVVIAGGGRGESRHGRRQIRVSSLRAPPSTSAVPFGLPPGLLRTLAILAPTLLPSCFPCTNVVNDGRPEPLDELSVQQSSYRRRRRSGPRRRTR